MNLGLLTLRIFSVLIIISTLIPLLKWDIWWVRVFDYPRLQKFVVLVVIMVIWLVWGFVKPGMERWIWVLILFICSCFLAFKVWPYTPLSKRMIDTVPYDEQAGLHILVANVYQYNRAFDKVVDLVNDIEPDVVFLVETDQGWIDGVSSIDSDYPHRIKLGKDNTYGLAFYSKLEIVTKEINYLIDPEIPSLELNIKLRNGEIITIYGIHPTPPVPGQNAKSTDRDAEILLVGQKSKNNPKPSIVIGDLNDVAWSHTTELFLKTSKMADPRRGRGLYNTFHANVPLMRWPLDHIFLSEHFGLGGLQVHRSINSDHFPIGIKAVLTKVDNTDSLEGDQGDNEEAREKIDRGLDDND